MGAAARVERHRETSPRLKARIAGGFYLLNILTGASAAFFVGRGLVRYGDAANLVATACYIVVTLLFYGLFEPVNRGLSLLAAFVSLVGCAVSALSLFHLLSIHLSSLVFFGLYCLILGYLILRSTFLPRILGALMAFGGLGWLTFFSPHLADRLYPYNLAPGVLGEGLLTIWLLAKGIDERRWHQQRGDQRR